MGRLGLFLILIISFGALLLEFPSNNFAYALDSANEFEMLEKEIAPSSGTAADENKPTDSEKIAKNKEGLLFGDVLDGNFSIYVGLKTGMISMPLMDGFRVEKTTNSDSSSSEYDSSGKKKKKKAIKTKERCAQENRQKGTCFDFTGDIMYKGFSFTDEFPPYIAPFIRVIIYHGLGFEVNYERYFRLENNGRLIIISADIIYEPEIISFFDFYLRLGANHGTFTWSRIGKFTPEYGIQFGMGLKYSSKWFNVFLDAYGIILKNNYNLSQAEMDADWDTEFDAIDLNSGVLNIGVAVKF